MPQNAPNADADRSNSPVAIINVDSHETLDKLEDCSDEIVEMAANDKQIEQTNIEQTIEMIDACNTSSLNNISPVEATATSENDSNKRPAAVSSEIDDNATTTAVDIENPANMIEPCEVNDKINVPNSNNDNTKYNNTSNGIGQLDEPHQTVEQSHECVEMGDSTGNGTINNGDLNDLHRFALTVNKNVSVRTYQRRRKVSTPVEIPLKANVSTDAIPSNEFNVNEAQPVQSVARRGRPPRKNSKAKKAAETVLKNAPQDATTSNNNAIIDVNVMETTNSVDIPNECNNEAALINSHDLSAIQLENQAVLNAEINNRESMDTSPAAEPIKTEPMVINDMPAEKTNGKTLITDFCYSF